MEPLGYIEILEMELKEFKLRHLFEAEAALKYVEDMLRHDMRAGNKVKYNRQADAETYLKHYKAHFKTNSKIELLRRLEAINQDSED